MIAVSFILFDVMLYDRMVTPVKGMDDVVVVLALAEGLIGILMAPRERDFAWFVK